MTEQLFRRHREKVPFGIRFLQWIGSDRNRMLVIKFIKFASFRSQFCLWTHAVSHGWMIVLVSCEFICVLQVSYVSSHSHIFCLYDVPSFKKNHQCCEGTTKGKFFYIVTFNWWILCTVRSDEVLPQLYYFLYLILRFKIVWLWDVAERWCKPFDSWQCEVQNW